METAGIAREKRKQTADFQTHDTSQDSSITECKIYSNFRKYAHPLHVKEGIITEKVFPVFSESFFGLVLA